MLLYNRNIFGAYNLATVFGGKFPKTFGYLRKFAKNFVISVVYIINKIIVAAWRYNISRRV